MLNLLLGFLHSRVMCYSQKNHVEFNLFIERSICRLPVSGIRNLQISAEH